MPEYGIQLHIDPLSTYNWPFQARESFFVPKLSVHYQDLATVCAPVTGAAIAGATLGQTDLTYSFAGSYSSLDADPPSQITWQATDHAGTQTGSSASYSWSTGGEKGITMTVSHCGGQTVAYHTITIEEPTPACPNPLTGLSLDGLAVAASGELHSFGGQVDGLPLAVLHNLSGVGYDELSWDSTGFDAGQYLAVVQLLDSDNQVLDTISEELTLGFVGMEAVSLSYRPGWLEPLDPVTLTLTLENTGTVPLTGTGVIAIHPAGDISTTMVISAAFSNLAPAGQVTLEMAWAVPEGDSPEYVLVGYGRALSQVSSPVSEKLGLVRRIYLPLTLR